MEIYIPDSNAVNVLFFTTIITIILAWHGATIRVKTVQLPVWVMTSLGTLLMAWQMHAVSPLSFIWFGVTGGAGYCLMKDIYKPIARIILIFTGFALAIGVLPGFQNFMLLDKVQISEGAVPYSLSLSLNKIGAGLIVFWVAFSDAERTIFRSSIIKQAAIPALFTIIITLCLSNLTLIHFDFKISTYFFIFAVSNLLFTAVSEESFFRGLIQRPLARYMGIYPAVLISAVLFGVAHYGMGRIDYVLVATMAGIGYAYIYTITKSVGASILTHWLLNLVHFMFFTYPYVSMG